MAEHGLNLPSGRVLKRRGLNLWHGSFLDTIADEQPRLTDLRE